MIEHNNQSLLNVCTTWNRSGVFDGLIIIPGTDCGTK
jgi:hypothetical protein